MVNQPPPLPVVLKSGKNGLRKCSSDERDSFNLITMKGWSIRRWQIPEWFCELRQTSLEIIEWISGLYNDLRSPIDVSSKCFRSRRQTWYQFADPEGMVGQGRGQTSERSCVLQGTLTTSLYVPMHTHNSEWPSFNGVQITGGDFFKLQARKWNSLQSCWVLLKNTHGWSVEAKSIEEVVGVSCRLESKQRSYLKTSSISFL